MPTEPAPEKKSETRAVAPRAAGDLGRIRRDLDRLFDDILRPGWSLRRLFEDIPRLPLGDFEISAPALDVYEENDTVVVKADLPGMAKDDIQVSLADDVLTIRGEKKREEKVEEKDYFFSERTSGSFSRSVRLPVEVQADKVSATFKEGVLELRLPKSEAAKKKSRSIKIE
jgi:HSP20 family protein